MREELISYVKRIYDRGLTTSAGGNLSYRDGEIMLITPTGKDKGTLVADDLSEISVHTGVCQSLSLPSCEWRMHAEIYQTRKDVKTIIHAHPLHICFFSAIEEELQTNIVSESHILVPKIAYVDYFMPSSLTLATAVAEASDLADIIILRNHGVVVIGDNFASSYQKLEALEQAAAIQYMTMNRVDVHRLTDKDCKEIEESFGKAK